MLADQICCPPQELIAALMSELVVDDLEVVVIDEQEGERRAERSRAHKLVAERFIEPPSVVQPGEVVRDRLRAGDVMCPCIRKRGAGLRGQPFRELVRLAVESSGGRMKYEL